MKWSRIIKPWLPDFFPCRPDDMACKWKWHFLLPDYCNVADYHTRMRFSGEEYWTMRILERVGEKLSKTLPREIFKRINEWFGQRLQINPHTLGICSIVIPFRLVRARMIRLPCMILVKLAIRLKRLNYRIVLKVPTEVLPDCNYLTCRTSYFS